MKRRQFIDYSIKGLSGLALYSLIANGTGCSRSSAQNPNIIVIIADDAGWNDVGYHGSEIKTPNIDRLVREGAELDNFYVSPMCSPTRAGLMTGLYPSRFGILGPIIGGSKQTLPPETVTLPGFLRDNGYKTAISGKWHLGLDPDSGPLKYGFDYSYGYFHGQIDPYTHLYKWGDKTWHRNDRYYGDEGHATDLITNEAVHFIRTLEDKEKPFFLYVAYSVPHFPLDEEQKWLDMYPDIQNESRRLFAASMTHMDDGIGKIMNTLEELNLEKDTMVIFLSDNGGQEKWDSGPDYYENKFMPNDVLGDNTPLRGWKGQLYEGGIKVPAVIYWKDHIAPANITELTTVQDLFPTIAHLVNPSGSFLPDSDGVNFWKAIDGKKLPERMLYWRSDKQFAVRNGNWKLVHTGTAINQGTTELFDLKTDPAEKINLIEQYPDVVTELMRELVEFISSDAL